jgi:hypothetical protein
LVAAQPRWDYPLDEREGRKVGEAELADAEPKRLFDVGRSVFDPSCGTGGLFDWVIVRRRDQIDPALDTARHRQLAQHDLAVLAERPDVGVLGAGAVVRQLQEPAEEAVAVVVDGDGLAYVDGGGEEPLVQRSAVGVQPRQDAIVAPAAHVSDYQIALEVSQRRTGTERLGLAGCVVVPVGNDVLPRLLARIVTVSTLLHNEPHDITSDLIFLPRTGHRDSRFVRLCITVFHCTS